MATLALDLGTSCGWALRSDTGLTSGTWDLSPGRGRPHRVPWLNLWQHLTDIGNAHELVAIVIEDVVAHPRPARMVGGKRKPAGTNVYAAHLFGSLKHTVAGFCEMNGGITLGKVAVATVKQAATGKGNASKAEMVGAAERRWPEMRITTHDQADAMWVLEAWRRRAA